MYTNSIRIGEPAGLLNYLNSFGTKTYINDPLDHRRLVVADQKIVILSRQFQVGDLLLLNGDQLSTVVKTNPLRPEMVLLAGSKLHELPDGKRLTFQVVKSRSVDYELPTKERSDALDQNDDSDSSPTFLPSARNLAPNEVFPVSPNGLTFTATTYPDGTQTPPPTRTSTDGTQTADPTRTSGDGALRLPEPAPFAPLTEFWAQQAKQYNASHRKKPIVAILDTGIDFRYDWTMTHPNGPSCPCWFNEGESTWPDTVIQKDLIGWSFAGAPNELNPAGHPHPFDDDVVHKHGTRLSAIIAQQTNWRAGGHHGVRIMPLKTHDFRGVGELFDIICALDYILERNRISPDDKILINASWGYYGLEYQLLTDRIGRLNARGIWFINAAGNQGDFRDSYHGHELRTEPDSPTERYPACYSDQFEYVKTVTTALHRSARRILQGNSLITEVTVTDNFSPQFVDVAIGAGQDSSFPEPLSQQSNQTVRGSSFATAYFVALLAQMPDFSALQTVIKQGLPPVPSIGAFVRDSFFIPIDIDVREENQ